MDLRKIGLGVVSMTLGLSALLVKQAMAIRLINANNGQSVGYIVKEPLGGAVGLFFLVTWIVGIWLIVAGFRTRSTAGV